MSKPLLTRKQMPRVACEEAISRLVYCIGLDKAEMVIRKGMIEKYEKHPPEIFVAYSRGACKRMYKILKELYI